MFEEGIWGLAVDDVGGFLYWAEYSTIKQASQDGSNTETLLTTGTLSVIWKLIHWISVTQNPLYHIVV